MGKRQILGQSQYLQIPQRISTVCCSQHSQSHNADRDHSHVHFCLVSQYPNSYLHHILGTSLLEAICGQFSCDIGWCLYGTMYARQRLPNHLNYSVGCQCTLDWLGMESSYYCTCGGTINLFRCWGELLILLRPDKSWGLLLKSGWFCHYFVKSVLCCSNFDVAVLHCPFKSGNNKMKSIHMRRVVHSIMFLHH